MQRGGIKNAQLTRIGVSLTSVTLLPIPRALSFSPLHTLQGPSFYFQPIAQLIHCHNLQPLFLPEWDLDRSLRLLRLLLTSRLCSHWLQQNQPSPWVLLEPAQSCLKLQWKPSLWFTASILTTTLPSHHSTTALRTSSPMRPLILWSAQLCMLRVTQAVSRHPPRLLSHRLPQNFAWVMASQVVPLVTCQPTLLSCLVGWASICRQNVAQMMIWRRTMSQMEPSCVAERQFRLCRTYRMRLQQLRLAALAIGSAETVPLPLGAVLRRPILW